MSSQLVEVYENLTWRKSFDERPNDASRLTHVRICITFDDRTKTDMTWDGPYHNSVSRSRIMIRVSFPVHICDHDTRRRYGYGDRIGQMIHVWTRLKILRENLRIT
ncbi:hypothetical protein SFRURICE_016890 [Spodoptera frugiperda]|nr:hypothetical protein SFRURICE_016890 [Spodoptera frugiperda]